VEAEGEQIKTGIGLFYGPRLLELEFDDFLRP